MIRVVEEFFNEPGLQLSPKAQSAFGRRKLKGVKFTAHVAEFDIFYLPLFFRRFRARVYNALVLPDSRNCSTKAE
jgi:hypothetical protein